MSQAVIIKSSKNGINLVLDASMPFPELLTEILHKFTEAERFFANASFAISFEGRELSDEEKYQVVDAIMEQTRVKILCILDSDEIRDAVIEQKCREMQQTNEEKEARRQSRGCFYRGSLLPSALRPRRASSSSVMSRRKRWWYPNRISWCSANSREAPLPE